jgi:acetyl esterase/lipase
MPYAPWLPRALLLAAALAASACSEDGASEAASGDGGVPPRQSCTGALVETHHELAYADTHETNVLNLYVPEHGNTCPLFVWVHGGAWSSGSQNVNEVVFAKLERIVSRGYAVASIDHRKSQHAVFPAQIHDVKAAVRFLRARSDDLGVDPERIVIGGDSSGGHLAALLAMSEGVPELEDPSQGHASTSTRVRGLVHCYGPTFLPDMDEGLAANGCPPEAVYHDEPTSPEARLLGCTRGLQTDCPQAVTADPRTYVDEDDPPALISHGDADCVVPWEQSRALHDALRAASVKTSFGLVDEGKHQIASCPPDDDVDAFLDESTK